MSIARRTHLVVAWLFVAGVIVQVFLAGLGVFAGPGNFATHATWGYTLEVLPIAMVVLALVGRLGRRHALFGTALFGMFMVQSILVAVRGDLPAIAALHPVNGFAILLVGIVAAREAWAERTLGLTTARAAPRAAPGIVAR